MSKDKFQQVLSDAFKNLTLCFGGIFLIHPIKDEVVWIMMKSIEEVYLDACRRVEKIDKTSLKEKTPKQELNNKTHPAIEKLLQVLDSGQKGI